MVLKQSMIAPNPVPDTAFLQGKKELNSSGLNFAPSEKCATEAL